MYDIDRIIDRLANSLGVTVEHIYPLMVRQAYLRGFMNLFWAMLILCIAILIIFVYHKVRIKYVKYIDFTEDFIVFLFLIALFVLFIFSINKGILGLLNPEWQAIEHLIRLIRRG